MQAKQFKKPNRKLAISIVLPAILTVLLILVMFYIIFIPSLEKNLIEDKRITIRELTNSAWHLLNQYNKRVESGELTLEEARERAAERLEGMRYGPEQKDYYWINDMQPVLVMHPYRPDLVGENVSQFRDPNGKRLFQAFVDTVRASGEGYVDYLWQWKDNPDRLVPKISFVKGFEPWGWIVGTGIYIEDVRDRVRHISHHLDMIFAGIIAVIILFTLIIILSGIRSEEKRSQVESRLVESERRYRDLFDSLADAVFIRNLDGTLLDFNPALERLLGLSRKELLGQSIQQFYKHPDEFNELMERVQQEGSVQNYPLQIVRKDGSTRMLLVSAAFEPPFEDRAARVQGILRDVTESRRLENQLHQSRKLEALGRLAGGVSHDFNNLLTAIIGNAELGVFLLEEDSQVKENLQEILNTSYRASELVRQLLAFSRHQVVNPVPLDLNAMLEQMVKMLRRVIGEDIALKLDLAPKLPLIEADSVQIDQLIINLAVNARDAMPRGGTLTIRTNCADAPLLPENEPSTDTQPWIHLEVGDTGVGIDDDALEHIFEPFYSTKSTGTGLGLATVFGIVKKAGGDIRVESTAGVGTAFHILFPPFLGEEVQGQTLHRDVLNLNGRESILLVEDDENVRRVTARILRQYGYRVFSAADGVAGLGIAAKLDRPADLLLCDLVMPKMDGIELSERIQALWPDTRILMMSAYTENIVQNRTSWQKDQEFLAKPFGPVTLAHKVRSILDRNVPSNQAGTEPAV